MAPFMAGKYERKKKMDELFLLEVLKISAFSTQRMYNAKIEMR
jgi:hypothetical protein